MTNPGRQHWDAVKWIFRYLKATTNYGITFVRQKSDLSVVGYVNADFAKDLDERRSTTGYVFTLARGPICWKSMIQSMVAMFTTEAEYMTVVKAAKEALGLVGLVKELSIQQGGVSLHCDSQSAIYLAKNQMYHTRTKHIDARFHNIRELVAIGELLLEKIHTSENVTNMLTNDYLRRGEYSPRWRLLELVAYINIKIEASSPFVSFLLKIENKQHSLRQNRRKLNL
jgi:hypothetical protein